MARPKVGRNVRKYNLYLSADDVDYLKQRFPYTPYSAVVRKIVKDFVTADRKRLQVLTEKAAKETKSDA